MKSSTLPQTETIPAAPSPAILPPTISIPLVTPTALTPAPAASTTTCPDSPKEVVPPPPADKTPVKWNLPQKVSRLFPVNQKNLPKKRRLKPAMRLVKHFWIPRPIMIYGQRYWHFLKLTIALIFLYCLQKSSLILLSKSRAIAVAPQPYLVLAGNNKGYQNTIKDAFINAIGIPVEFHSILKGTVDESGCS